MSTLKTTAEERAAWWDRVRGAYGGVNRHPELPFQSLDEAERCLSDLDCTLTENASLTKLLFERAERITELETMTQHLADALARCSNDFARLAALDRIIDEKHDKIETILAQVEARRQKKGKPS
jgi:hypothetical protein